MSNVAIRSAGNNSLLVGDFNHRTRITVFSKDEKDDIETEIESQNRAEIPSTAIGDMVMKRLKNLDFIAYIRFASVYRDFTDIESFKREIESLTDTEAELKKDSSQLLLIPDEETRVPSRVRSRSRK